MGIDEYLAKLSKEDKKAVRDLNKKVTFDFIPTGSWVMDRLIGDGQGKFKSGGLPRGHMVEVFGDESCGKTTTGISACVEAQRLGGTPIWLDYERTFHKDYAQNLGLDIAPNKFVLIEPENFEHGQSLLVNVIDEVKPSIIVVDSVSAMIPRAFLEGILDETGRIGEQARLMSNFLSVITKRISTYSTCLMFINQLRSVIKTSKYDPGPLEETSGGRAIKYYASLRIKMKKGKVDYIKVKSPITGKSEDRPNNIQIKVTLVKNKIDTPYYSGPVFLKFGEGFDNITSIIALADNTRVIKKTGGYYKFESGGETIFYINGRENLRAFLESNPDALNLLSSSVRLKVDEEAKAENDTVADNVDGSSNTEALTNLVDTAPTKKATTKKVKKNAKSKS